MKSEVKQNNRIVSNLAHFNDLNCKNVLSIKKITASIFQYLIPPFSDCSWNEIMEMIDSQQLTKEGKFFESLNTERIEGSRYVKFDLLLKCLMPNGKVGYFDLEPHNSNAFNTLSRRSEIYTSFGIVSQLKTENLSSNTYEGLKDFHSLWMIRTNQRESHIHVVEEYIQKDDDISLEKFKGSYHHKIYVYLGTELSEQKGIRLLQLLFSTEIEDKEMNDILEKEYGYRLDEEESEERNKMQEFLLSYYNDGINKGLLQGRSEGLEAGKLIGKAIGAETNMLECIRNLMEEAGISVQKAMSLLRVPESEQAKYIVQLEDIKE